MLQWILEEGLARNNTDDQIIQRILLINMAAIHTSSNVCRLTGDVERSRNLIPSQSITHAIYHLAEHPEYLAPLREESEPIIQEEGWTKAAMGRMWKLDSVMRESQRLNGINTSALYHSYVVRQRGVTREPNEPVHSLS